MGYSHACQLVELLSQALQWIRQHKFNFSSMSHILDDFFGAKQPECHYNLSSLFILSKIINLPKKHAKTVLPVTKVTLHGIEVNTLNQTLALPLKKVVSLRHKLMSLAKRKKVTLKEIQ